MIIIGIDPGTTRIGYGFISYNQGKSVCIKYGIIAQTGDDPGQKVLSACLELENLIEEHKPDLASIEKLFFFKNKKTVTAVSEMRGATILTLAKKGIPIHEFTPQQVKQSVSSYGRADKAQVQNMVRMITGLKDPIWPDDAADALAIAICCAHTIVL